MDYIVEGVLRQMYKKSKKKTKKIRTNDKIDNLQVQRGETS